LASTKSVSKSHHHYLSLEEAMRETSKNRFEFQRLPPLQRRLPKIKDSLKLPPPCGDVWCVTWRGDRDASQTPAGKGQRGVVAVYLTKGNWVFCREIEDAWSTLWRKWHGCLVEHPYHAFGGGCIKSGTRCRLTVAQYASSCRHSSPRDRNLVLCIHNHGTRPVTRCAW